MNKYSQGTGGGPSSDSLTNMDIKVLSSMASQVLEGNDIPETDISFNFPPAEVEVMTDTFQVETVLEHDYFIKDPQDQDAETKLETEITGNNQAQGSRKMEENTSTLLTPKPTKTKRSVAAQRLLKSSNATTVLADVSSKELKLRERYYNKKLELMERQVVAVENIALALKKN